MSPLLIIASTVISLALVAYTIGVFSERRAGELKPAHLAFFWLGLACDTTGTTIMTIMAQGSGGAISPLHGITGLLAVILMLLHAGWATYVTLRGNEKSRHSFHLLSICVWLVWLVPYFVGLLIGIPGLPCKRRFRNRFRRRCGCCVGIRSAGSQGLRPQGVSCQSIDTLWGYGFVAYFGFEGGVVLEAVRG